MPFKPALVLALLASPALAQDHNATYEAELTRIHQGDILSQPVEGFETLFMSYCQKGGGSAESCACAWPILVEASTSSAVPYIASRTEGDDVFQRLPRETFYEALDAFYDFSDRRAVCD